MVLFPPTPLFVRFALSKPNGKDIEGVFPFLDPWHLCVHFTRIDVFPGSLLIVCLLILGRLGSIAVKGKAIAAQITQSGGKAIAVSGDVTDPAFPDRLIGETIK